MSLTAFMFEASDKIIDANAPARTGYIKRPFKGCFMRIAAVQAALESAGVEFIEENGGGAGVRLQKTKAPRARIVMRAKAFAILYRPRLAPWPFSILADLAVLLYCAPLHHSHGPPWPQLSRHHCGTIGNSNGDRSP